MSASSPNLLCMAGCGVSAGNLEAGSTGEQGSLRSRLGYQVGEGSMLVFEGTCRCGVPVG